MFKTMRFLRPSKCSKATVELRFTSQKANACSPWSACSAFDWKYSFWVNLVQKLKIVSLSWNLLLKLIRICRITWWCLLFLFWTRNTFFSKFSPKNQNCQFQLKFGTKTNFNMWNSIMMFPFSIFDHKYPSWSNLVQKFKTVFSKWNLIGRLIRICKIQWCCQFLDWE